MANFNLNKGEKFKVAKAINNILVGLGWDAGDNVDVDVHAFGCQSGKFYNDASHAVTYANSDLKKGTNKSFGTLDDSIIHTGDNRTGQGDGDDEQVKINLEKLPKDIDEISVFITIHEAKSRKPPQNFGLVKNSYIHVLNSDTGAELCRYDLRNEFASAITIHVGSLLKNNGDWLFHAVGAGSDTDGLEEILNNLS